MRVVSTLRYTRYTFCRVLQVHQVRKSRQDFSPEMNLYLKSLRAEVLRRIGYPHWTVGGRSWAQSCVGCSPALGFHISR